MLERGREIGAEPRSEPGTDSGREAVSDWPASSNPPPNPTLWPVPTRANPRVPGRDMFLVDGLELLRIARFYQESLEGPA